MIDGNKYEVTNAVNHDHFDCKGKFLGIIMHIENGLDDLSAESLASWKKELIGNLKEYEKRYVKHAKSTNPLLAKI